MDMANDRITEPGAVSMGNQNTELMAATGLSIVCFRISAQNLINSFIRPKHVYLIHF